MRTGGLRYLEAVDAQRVVRQDAEREPGPGSEKHARCQRQTTGRRTATAASNAEPDEVVDEVWVSDGLDQRLARRGSEPEDRGQLPEKAADGVEQHVDEGQEQLWTSPRGLSGPDIASSPVRTSVESSTIERRVQSDRERGAERS
eukprot:1246396-Rhodomonas_salina.7